MIHAVDPTESDSPGCACMCGPCRSGHCHVPLRPTWANHSGRKRCAYARNAVNLIPAAPDDDSAVRLAVTAMPVILPADIRDALREYAASVAA